MKAIPEWAQGTQLLQPALCNKPCVIDSACTALKNQVAALFSSTGTNVWSEASFESSYDSDNTTDNSCKTVAKLIFTTGSSTVNPITVRKWCIYYIGVSRLFLRL